MTDKEFRVCTNCGVMDLKSNMWNMNYGYYLCDDCYWEDECEKYRQTNIAGQ